MKKSKSLIGRLQRDYEIADKKDKDAKRAKIEKFWSFISALGLSLEEKHDAHEDEMNFTAEKVVEDTGYERAKATISDDGVISAKKVEDEDEIAGVEVIDCRPDGRIYGETLNEFLKALTEVSSRRDLIDLEARFPRQMSDPDVSAFVSWCWDVLETDET